MGGQKRTIAVRFMRIARLLRTHFDQRAHSRGLTRAQWSALAAISRAEGATQRQIAQNLEVGNVTAGRLIDRLDDAGYVDRRNDPADRRAYRLHATPAAAAVLAKLSILGAEEEAEMLAGLSEDDVATLSALLDRIVANLTARDCVHGDATDTKVANG